MEIIRERRRLLFTDHQQRFGMMTSSLLRRFLWGAILFFSLSPGTSAETVPQPSPPTIAAVTIAASRDSAPYYYLDASGQPKGWLVDLWRLWAEKNHITVSFAFDTFEKSIQMVARGEADLHAGLFYSADRAELLDFVVPVTEVSTHFFFHKELIGIRTPEDLGPYRIGVIAGDRAIDYLRNLPDIALRVFPHNTALFDAIANGTVKVFVKDTAIARRKLVERGLFNDFTCLTDHPLYVQSFMAAVRKGRTALSSRIAQGMKRISATERATIDRRWAGIAQLKTDNVLVVACQPDYLPFTALTPDGMPSGLLVDLWRLWAKKTNRAVEFHFEKADRLQQSITNGRADVSMVVEGATQAEHFLLSSPIFPVASAMFHPAEEKRLPLQALSGHPVGVLVNSYHAAALRQQYPEIRWTPFNDPAAMLLAAVNGDIRALAGEAVPLQSLINRLGLSGKLAVAEPPLFSRFFRAALHRDRTALLAVVEEGMHAISNSELLALEQRWIPNPKARLFTRLPRPRPLTAAEQEWLRRHQVLRVGVDANWPPFEYVDDTRTYQGIAADILGLVEQRLGVRMEPQPGPSWTAVLEKVRNRDLDLVACITPSAQRSAYLEFSTPYLSARNVVLSVKNAPFFNGLDDLAGKRVAVVDGYLVQQAIARDHPGIVLVPVSNLDTGVRMVSQERVAAYVDTLVSITYAMNKQRLSNVMVAAATPYTDDMAFGVRKDWPVLAAILNKTLDSIPEAEKAAVKARWTERRVEWTVDWPFIRRVVAGVVGASLVFFLIFLFWNRRLAREVKSRKAAEAALGDHLMLLEALIDTLPNPIFITDTRARYTGCNRAYEAAFGVHRSNIIGKTLSEICEGAGNREAFLAQDHMVLQERKPRHSEVVLRFADGRLHDTLFWKVPFRLSDGKIGGMLGVIVDITERKQMETAVVEARDRAEAATRAKSAFLANMSHEIRTPMNAIVGMAHLALQTRLTEKQLDYLQKIETSAMALMRIINDILDFSKIEARRLEMETIPFRLDDVLENLAALMAPRIQEKGLEFLFAVSPHVPQHLVGDPLRIGQILNNLVSNAVKFTHKGEIVVAASRISRDGASVTLQFEVRDTGIGLSPEAQAGLFKPFSQADASTTRKYGGTGLGLAICKRLCEMMNGRIWVESREGAGSRFFFTAVLGLQQDRSRPDTRFHETLAQMPVLVVDDSPTSRNALGEMLQSFGLHVTLAAGAEEALRLMDNTDASRAFRLVLMDWKMPGMDGITAARHIKERTGPTAAPAVLLVTAYGREEVQFAARRAGLDGFLVKPVSPSVLFDTILVTFHQKTRPGSGAPHDLPEPPATAAQLSGARILVVEDNEINQQIAQEILERAGARITVAENGKNALECLSASAFDAVLMDVQMPVMDGFEATAAIRQTPAWKDLPVIAMTAHAMAGDREKGLAAGMSDYVTKPIDPELLVRTLAKWAGSEQPAAKMPPATPAAAPVFAALPETLAGIDTKAGLLRVGGNQALYRDLLVKFRTSYHAAASELRRALADGALDDARRLAHTIKGVAGNVGAARLSETAGNLETAIVNNGADVSSALLADFEALLAGVIDGLQAVDDLRQPVRTSTHADTGALAALLEELTPHVQARKPGQCKVLMAQITAAALPENLAASVSSLADQLRRYQFKSALKTIHDLKKALAR